MECKDLLRMLNEYIDGEIDPSMCEKFEEHLAGCNPCQVVVDTLRKTVKLYKGAEEYELPVEFRQHLHATLRVKFKEKMQGGKADGEGKKPG